jgi:hypothetical protein
VALNAPPPDQEKRTMSPRPARIASIAAVIATALASAGALAQTLYKLIDKNGKVTYSEQAPKDFDGKVIRIDVDPQANRATLPKYEPKPAATTPAARRPNAATAKRAAAAADVDGLRERVAERRAALEEAQNNPAEEDVQWVGNAKGGTRRVPTAAYERRLAELERALKEAQDELEAAEKNVR